MKKYLQSKKTCDILVQEVQKTKIIKAIFFKAQIFYPHLLTSMCLFQPSPFSPKGFFYFLYLH